MYLIDDRAVVWAQSLLLNPYATLPLMKNMQIYAGSKEGVTEGFERRTDSIWIVCTQGQRRIVLEREEDPLIVNALLPTDTEGQS